MAKRRLVVFILLVPLFLVALRACLSPVVSDMNAWRKEADRFKHVNPFRGSAETQYSCSRCGKPTSEYAISCAYCGAHFVGTVEGGR